MKAYSWFAIDWQVCSYAWGEKVPLILLFCFLPSPQLLLLNLLPLNTGCFQTFSLCDSLKNHCEKKRNSIQSSPTKSRWNSVPQPARISKVHIYFLCFSRLSLPALSLWLCHSAVSFSYSVFICFLCPTLRVAQALAPPLKGS